MGSLEDVHKVPVSSRDLRDCVFARGLLVAPSDERLREVCPADGEADVPGDARGRRQPLTHLLVVFTSSEDDARDPGPPAAPRDGDDLLTVLAHIEPFDLPDVRVDPCILTLLDRLHPDSRSYVRVVRFHVPSHATPAGLSHMPRQF